MRRIVVAIVSALLVLGCAAGPKPKGPSDSGSPERRLADAVALLAGGRTGEATTLLAEITAGPGVPGVTDEAWFRLALLRLGAESDATASGRQMLERLQSEYPDSPWSKQAASLVALLASTTESQRANRELKSQNANLRQEVEKLTREGDELRKRLEKLKHLDLELEGKSR